MHELNNILGDHAPFLDTVFSLLKKENLNVSDLELDHICYRVETYARYAELQHVLETCGKLLSETQINGRPISTYKLKKPLEYNGRNIRILELPAPKSSQGYKEGFEHIEFVINTPFKEFLQTYENLVFDTSDLQKANNKSIARKYENCSVKFHQNSLEYVIEHEQ